MNSSIAGVEIKKLTSHHDERGYFRELIRNSDAFFSEGFGQWSISHIDTGIIKAWHIHHIQTDWWYVHQGLVKLVICDLRPLSKTFKTIEEYLLGDEDHQMIIKVPPHVAHGCKVIKGPADLFYITSQTYNPDDEGRIPPTDEAIGYDWKK
ncbi:MAG: nucleotide sugar epimerase [uncultured bacterium]|nr:MAG: nucleotide sugar epimerase [uncultured bacterium]